jgi:hypothetical protein
MYYIKDCILITYILVSSKVRDEYREEYDAGRGGWGAIERKRQDYQTQNYESVSYVPDGASSSYHQATTSKKKNRIEWGEV